MRAVRDVAIASAFLVLRATEMGLGTCWVGLIKEDVLKRELHVPDRFCISFVICIGYPDKYPLLRPRKKWSDILIGKG